MLDPYLRTLIDRPLNMAGKRLAKLGFSPINLTFIGFGMGLLAMGLIVYQLYSVAFFFILMNRVLDGLDGAVARQTQTSDFGGVLDITCDFIVYAGIVFAFGLADPENLLYSGFLIFSFIGPITTFLAYATIAAKRQINTNRRGIKSFYYLGGICEGTETALFLLFICLFPKTFQWAALIFGGLCWLTTIGRVYCAWIDFGKQKLPIVESLIENRQ